MVRNCELRDIFRADDGSEWYARDSLFYPEIFLFVRTGLGSGFINKKYLTVTIEGPYRIWTGNK